MTSATRTQQQVAEEVDYVFADSSSATVKWVPQSDAATTSFSGFVNRFNSYLLPLAAIAVIAGPSPPPSRRGVGTRTSSQSTFAIVPWLLDDWSFTEEFARIEEIRALNALLALPAEDGIWLDLDGE